MEQPAAGMVGSPLFLWIYLDFRWNVYKHAHGQLSPLVLVQSVHSPHVNNMLFSHRFPLLKKLLCSCCAQELGT